MSSQPTSVSSGAGSHRLTARVGRRTMVLGATYALALAALERKLPIKPTWVALEVIGGVALVGLPVMLVARSAAEQGVTINWRDYEDMVVAGFAGAGIPICIWQAIEYLLLPVTR